MSTEETAKLRNPLLIKLLWWGLGAALLVALNWIGGIVHQGLRSVTHTVGLYIGNETIAFVLLFVAYIVGLPLLAWLVESLDKKRPPMRSFLSGLLSVIFALYESPRNL